MLKSKPLWMLSVSAFVFVLFLRLVFFTFFVIKSHSMTPVLKENDIVLSLRHCRPYRGDIVIFKPPKESVGGTDCQFFSVKRVTSVEKEKKLGFFLKGDNTNVSIDSKDYGFVPENMIYGKAVMIVYPVRRIRFL